MDYPYPRLLIDNVLKRLHTSFDVITLGGIPERAEDVEFVEHRRKCDFGGSHPPPFISFMEAVRLINEEGYRPCGNCLEEGGEVSNWKERAETAESKIEDLEERLSDAEARATVSEERLTEIEEDSA